MPRRSFPKIGIPTLSSHLPKSHTLKYLRLSTPNFAPAVTLLLNWWNPAVCSRCTGDHADNVDTMSQRPQAIVKRGEWQHAKNLGDWTLEWCTVVPAFLFESFE